MRGKRTKQRAQFLILGLIPAHAGKTTRPTPSQSKPGAHPHSRGENVIDDGEAHTGGGSSPLTRGNLRVVRAGQVVDGLIPTHAGKTKQATQRPRDTRAHPRSRGENVNEGVNRERCLGSSPLTRGKLSRGTYRIFRRGLIPAHAGKTGGVRVSPFRFGAHPRSRGENRKNPAMMTIGSWLIPAHAGKTSAQILRSRRARAHPRSRGENEGVGTMSLHRVGSSPLTRGKRSRGVAASRGPRLIPAHAGKTRWPGLSLRESGAHPRSRGENGGNRSRGPFVEGSSPLTRGKHSPRTGYYASQGLIPAHAGKTGFGAGVAGVDGAHPRSRGENLIRSLSSVCSAGSSPLTRGKQFKLDESVRVGGLIPAHAGKTRMWGPCLCTGWAHPRSRGENTRLPFYGPQRVGSSPLTRGKQCASRNGYFPAGLIPAHAGKT